MSNQVLVDKNTERTSLSNAFEEILELLFREQKPYTVSGIAKDAKLHRRTVEKCLYILSTLEAKWLQDYKLRIVDVDNKSNRKIITLEKRMGLLKYPEEIQNAILRHVYFPLPSSQMQLIVHIYLRNAISEKNAIELSDAEDPIVLQLLKQGQILKSKKDKFYLSDEGIIVAKGGIKIFPFLKDYQTTSNRTSKKKP
jgi:hypothetical protein